MRKLEAEIFVFGTIFWASKTCVRRLEYTNSIKMGWWSRLIVSFARIMVWTVVIGHAAGIRVQELDGLDPQQGDEQSIGILNTIFTNNVGPTTTRGLLIDGGSGGSRIHVYEWGPRVFKQVPPPISYPTTNEAYTGRMSNGVQLCWRENQTEEDLLENLTTHLAPLLDFARSTLTDQGLEDQFATIPIWFKATGGVSATVVLYRTLCLIRNRSVIRLQS